MAGVGPPPKDPSRRARRNADPIPTTIIRFEQGVQPDLPAAYDWPQQTRAWWSMWANAPQAEHFMETDWQFLLDTALVHAELWSGNVGVAAELRLRVAKMGSTLEDRARLRLAFAEADEKDAARPVGSSSRERYGKLKAVSGGEPAQVVSISKPPRGTAKRRSSST